MKTQYPISQLFKSETDKAELFNFAQKNGVSFHILENNTHKGPIQKIIVQNPGEERQDYIGGSGSKDKSDIGDNLFIEGDKIYIR